VKYYKLPHKSAISPAKFLNLESPLVVKALQREREKATVN